MLVAPYSPIARNHAKATPAPMLDDAAGNATRAKIFHSLAPSVRAASAKIGSIAANAAVAAMATNEPETKNSETATPSNESGTVKPWSASQPPAGAFVPNA